MLKEINKLMIFFLNNNYKTFFFILNIYFIYLYIEFYNLS